MEKLKVAIIVSHPIQHFIHFYRALAVDERIDLKVFFCSRIGTKPYFDIQMNKVIKWADDLTSGFNFSYLSNADKIDRVGFFSINNINVESEILNFSPDKVIIYGYAQLSQLRALFFCKILNIPVLMITDTNARPRSKNIKNFVRNLFIKTIFNSVDSFLTVGDQNEIALNKLGVSVSRMYRCPFTIDEVRYRLARDRRAQYRSMIRKKIGLSENDFVGISVGKLIPLKRTIDTVRSFIAFSKVRSSDRPVRLIICGDGPELNVIQSLVQSHLDVVKLVGFVNIDELPFFYCAADVLIHAADRDNHPLVCSEAACIGLPMILSDQVGTIGRSDISRPNENSLIFPVGDIVKLTEHLIKLYENEPLLKTMSLCSVDIFEQCNLSSSLRGIHQALKL